jgi:hypothetical protein
MAKSNNRLRLIVTLVGWAAGSGIWAVLVYRYLFHGWPGSQHRFGDLYQRLSESMTILDGRDPYFLGAHISDNVPPSVSLLHLPLAWVGRPWAGFLAVFLSCASTAVILGSATATVTRLGRSGSLLAMTAVGIPIVGVLLYPGASALSTGQDQLWFMALVVVDILIISRRRTGVLTGAVAGLSLWPGIFLVATAARARWKGITRATVGASLTLLAGALFSWSASWRYWTYLVPSGQISSRGVNSTADWPVDGFGGPWNLSVNGALIRWPLGGPFATKSAWIVAFVLVISAVVVISWLLYTKGLRLTPLAVLAMGAVMSSPFAWVHHWVWVALLLPFAAIELWQRARLLSILFALGELAFVRQIGRRLDALVLKQHGETIYDNVAGALVLNRYALVSIVLLVGCAVLALRGKRNWRVLAP